MEYHLRNEVLSAAARTSDKPQLLDEFADDRA
jgi:hypothetical protein